MPTYFVDPSAATNGDGSPNSPFNTITAVASNDLFLVRRTGDSNPLTLPALSAKVRIHAYPKPSHYEAAIYPSVPAWDADVFEYFSISNAVDASACPELSLRRAKLTAAAPCIQLATANSLQDVIFAPTGGTGKLFSLTAGRSAHLGGIIVDNANITNLTLLDVPSTNLVGMFKILLNRASASSFKIAEACTDAQIKAAIYFDDLTQLGLTGDLTTNLNCNFRSELSIHLNEVAELDGEIKLNPNFSGSLRLYGELCPPIRTLANSAKAVIHADILLDGTGLSTPFFQLTDSASLQIYPYGVGALIISPDTQPLIDLLDSSTAYFSHLGFDPLPLSTISAQSQLAYRDVNKVYYHKTATALASSEAASLIGGGTHSYKVTQPTAALANLTLGKPVNLWNYAVGAGARIITVSIAQVRDGHAGLKEGDIELVIFWSDLKGKHTAFSGKVRKVATTWSGISNYDGYQITLPFSVSSSTTLQAQVVIRAEVPATNLLYIDSELVIV